MAITAIILNYRRFLKRRNYSVHTIKNYMHTLQQFVVWVDVPIEEVSHKKLLAYLDHLLDRGLQPKTINCHLDSIRGFYHYLIEEEQVAMVNPVKRGYALRLSRPLPRHLRDEEVDRLFKVNGQRLPLFFRLKTSLLNKNLTALTYILTLILYPLCYFSPVFIAAAAWTTQ